MRNKLFYLAILLTIILTPSVIKASEGMYVGMLGGVNLLQNNHFHGHKVVYNTGYAAGAFAGYGFCNNVRVEGEFLYRRNNIKRFKMDEESFHCGHRRSYSLMANCLYDFDFCFPVTPYLGLGVGADRDTLVVNFKEGHTHKNKTHFAAQAIAGFSYPVYDYTEMSIDYRYHWAMSHLYNHTFTLGLKYIF